MSGKVERCCVCDGPTGRCGEDSIFLPSMDPNGNDLGPLCEECCDAALAPFTDSSDSAETSNG